MWHKNYIRILSLYLDNFLMVFTENNGFFSSCRIVVYQVTYNQSYNLYYQVVKVLGFCYMFSVYVLN